MYLKMNTFFLEPNQETALLLYNGTFDKSDNVIDRDRMVDASLVGRGERRPILENQWTEQDSTTILRFKTGEPGTWLAGVSTAPRSIELKAEDFNKYLEHDGVTDMLTYRTENNLLEQDAAEKYSKHVKAIYQVGDSLTDDWKTRLGYPIEFVPLSNPYASHTGDTLRVQLLFDGKPLANQLVYANYRSAANGHSHNDGNATHSHKDDDAQHTHEDGKQPHSHDTKSKEHTHTKSDGTSVTHSHSEESHTHKDETQSDTNSESHVHTAGQTLRTDADGMIDVHLEADGIWYLRTIHLVESDEEGLTHESNWATLTFETSHSHGNANDADHTHKHEEGIPSYVFWIISIVIVGGLFFYFSRNKGRA
jgi:uncharacterized GH25 family protein